ncbi:unnamed protein product, partial [Scytosiphon promiscuus]
MDVQVCKCNINSNSNSGKHTRSGLRKEDKRGRKKGGLVDCWCSTGWSRFAQETRRNADIAMESPAVKNPDLLGCLVDFVSDKQFLFFATVSRSWRAAWGQRPTLTSFVTPDTSAFQLQHSFRRGLPLDRPAICAALARLGKLGPLQCARENGCQWDEATCSGAAAAGHLPMLAWARDNGCPWDA